MTKDEITARLTDAFESEYRGATQLRYVVAGVRAGLSVVAAILAEQDARIGALDNAREPAEQRSDPDPPKPCARCRGCGKIANSEEGEPWSDWDSLPAGADLAVRMGIVRPITCPSCHGSGEVKP